MHPESCTYRICDLIYKQFCLDMHVPEVFRTRAKNSQVANLGLIYKTQGDLAKTRTHWTRALELFKRVGARPQVELVQGWLNELGE